MSEYPLGFLLPKPESIFYLILLDVQRKDEVQEKSMW